MRLGARPALMAAALLVVLGAMAVHAGTARAVTGDIAIPGDPVLVSNATKPPAGYRLTATKVLRIASADTRVKVELRRHPRATPYEYTKSERTWQVSWFSPGRHPKELMQVYVDDATRTVTQVWTGFQVAWSMARGYDGAFGRRVNALYVWLPLCVLFVAPFLPLPRWLRRRRSGYVAELWRPSLLHLDLLMLLGFSISLAFFNHAEIGLSVPLVYPFLVYLLARMLLLAFGKGVPRRPLSLNVPTNWLLCGMVFLMGLRIGLNILNSNVIDVGYAGVIGADKLIHGKLLYGLWPHDNAYGDTYGPVNYYFYLPFRAIFGWSGKWDALPAAHAAAIAFDLLTVGELYLLGRRLRDHAMGVLLTYAWAAYPFTVWVLSSNTNDALVPALVLLSLLVITSAPARGVVGALAGLTKFAPLALAPLLLRGVGGPPRKRSVAAYVLAFGLTVFAAMLPVVLNGDLHHLWHDSISYQATRAAPFSIWGLWGGLGLVQHLVQGGAVALAIVVMVVPARRGLVEVAALGAAVLIALQLTVNYWLYAYTVWFFPLVVAAIFAAHPRRRGGTETRFGALPAPVEAPEPGRPVPVPLGF